MNRRTITPTRLALAGASLIFAGAIIASGALANDPPVTVPSTGEEPIGTVTLPTPIWGTPTLGPAPVLGTPTAIDAIDIVELPSTGTGSSR